MNPSRYLSLANKNLGFTLIELMISMTLGLGLMGGLMAMYLSGNETDKTRTELSDMDANATIALNQLRKTIRHAGYGGVAADGLNKAFHTDDAVPDNPLCRDGKKLIVSGADGSAGLLNPPADLSGYTKDHDDGDVITAIYRPDSPDKGAFFSDCASGKYSTGTSTDIENRARLVACSTDTTVKTSNGMHEAKDAKVYSSFFLRQLAGKPKQLVCFGSRSSASSPFEIADNIENMQIRYAVKQNETTIYRTAKQIEDSDNTESEWSSVSSVQVALLVGSENKEIIKTPVARSFQLLDKTITKLATDRRMYQVYSTTIYLHNVGVKQ